MNGSALSLSFILCYVPLPPLNDSCHKLSTFISTFQNVFFLGDKKCNLFVRKKKNMPQDQSGVYMGLCTSALMFLDRGLRSYYWFPNNHNQIRDTSRLSSFNEKMAQKKHSIYLKHHCHCQPLTPYSKDKLHKKLFDFFLWFYLHFNNARFPSGC